MTVVLAAEQRTVVRDLRGTPIGWGREGLAWRVVVVKIEEESRRMDMDDGLIESNRSKMCEVRWVSLSQFQGLPTHDSTTGE